MTRPKSLTELEILELARSAISAKVSRYMEAKARSRDELEIYNRIIEEYDNQLEELEERMKALEEDQENE